MARSVPWRRTINDIVCWRQAEAINSVIYILRKTGPTGFLLKEEGESKNVKVFLGDPNSCTCAQFKKDKDLCKHICWVLLKVFRIPQDNPLTWQLGLVEREINEILRGVTQPKQRQQQEKKVHHTLLQAADGREVKSQREISEEDVCPICQDELLSKHLPVTFCKFGCGNSVHIRCMKVYADHQQSNKEDKSVKCPMCREDFGPINLLKEEMRNANRGQRTQVIVNQERHLGSNCQSCHMSPIEGKCYRCSTCADFMLCQSCFNSPLHTHHQFEYRQKRNQRWQRVKRRDNGLLPEAVINNLMNRDITADDYDYLLQLDRSEQNEGSDLTEEEINSLPQEKIREGGQLLAPGMQCRICLRAYEVSQLVRRLPCRHKFHKECIDNWLLHTRPTCPIDGHLISAPLQNVTLPSNLRERRGSVGSCNSIASQPSITLEIPGVGFASNVTTGDRLSIGNRGQQPVQSNRVQHQTPSRLELAGTAFMSSDSRSSSIASNETTKQSRLPGNKFFHRVELNRRRSSNRQLSSTTDRQRVPIKNNNLEQDLDSFLTAGPISESPNISRASSVFSLPPSREVIRGRTVERQQVLPEKRVQVQDLYLGNNPRTNPAEQGQVLREMQRGQIKSGLRVLSNNTSSMLQGVDTDIQLEGLGLENLTLRDIID